MLPKRLVLVFALLNCLLGACSSVPDTTIRYDPASLRLSGEQTLAAQAEFVERFPYRHSGASNNQLAAEWLRDRFASYGLDCTIDKWTIINYSQPVSLRNVVCALPGESPQQILIMAHFDQSPDTIQGADNDGSGIALLLQLAEIFASEETPRYTLMFIGTDAEEYGMIGSKRYITTHRNPNNIIAGFSLDNVGKQWSNGMDMSPIGQFRGYGPIWLQLTAREAAREAGDLWLPQIRSPVDQILNQAVPVSYMDQGPMVAAGIPALGFATLHAKGTSDLVWDTYHTPDDTMEYQSAAALHQAGRISEALLRQLLSMEKFPNESGPYLYFDNSQQVLRGLSLWSIFVAFVSCAFFGSHLIAGGLSTKQLTAWRNVLPHYLGLWLPLLASILLLYLFVMVGLMDEYHVYPALAKDEPLFEPRWPAVTLFLVGLTVFLTIGRKFAGHYDRQMATLDGRDIMSFAFFVVGLAALYILVINPFSLIFLIPLTFWLLIGGRNGAGRLLDIILFGLGGLVAFVLLYYFGFVILRNNLAVLWYLMMMVSIRMVGFSTAVAITAIIAAGLSMIVTPPRGA